MYHGLEGRIPGSAEVTNMQSPKLGAPLGHRGHAPGKIQKLFENLNGAVERKRNVKVMLT